MNFKKLNYTGNIRMNPDSCPCTIRICKKRNWNRVQFDFKMAPSRIWRGNTDENEQFVYKRFWL